MSRHYGICAGGVVLLIAMLASCAPSAPGQSDASDEPSFTGYYAEIYSSEYERAKASGNDFATQALSDGKVTEAEAQEAADRFVQCMTDKGYSASMDADGSSTVYHPGQTLDEAWTKRMDNDQSACQKESGVEYLNGLYHTERVNPDGENDTSMIVDCLRRHEVVDDSMSDDQIIQELNKSMTGFSWIPFDAADPNYDANKSTWLQECRVNPREF